MSEKNEERPLWKRLFLDWPVWAILIIVIAVAMRASQSLQQTTVTQPAEETELALLTKAVENLPSAEDIAKAVAEAMASASTPESEFSQGETCQRLPDYDRPPQPQIGHPSAYVETGVNDRTMCWTVPIKEGFVAIIGGFNVDEVSNGVYRAIPGPDTATVEVTDGFALVIVEEVAREEFCFRVGQAIEYGWAHETIEPLSSWPPCEPPVVAEAEPTVVSPTEVGLPPQPQIRHPSWYDETGVSNTKSWTLTVPSGSILIVGGFIVDGSSNGVYKAWPGGQEVTVTVTDGFALVITNEWAEAEFCFRVAQAKEFGWAHEHIQPLEEWEVCQ